MKIAKGLIPLLVLIFAVSMIIGCSHSDKSDVEGVITNELNLLKNLDSDTAQKYISYQEPVSYTHLRLWQSLSTMLLPMYRKEA